MITCINRLTPVAAVLLLLLAGCSADGGEQSSVSGSASRTQGVAQPRPFRYPPTPPPPRRPPGEAIADRLYFAFDRAELNPEARGVVEKWAAWLKEYPAKPTIEGHCDERGTREYNLGLGERRAAAVKLYLVSLGIDARRISTISYGKERPEAPGSDAEAWSKNRRAVMVIY